MTLSDKLTALKIAGNVTKTENNGFYTCYHVVFNPDITLNKIHARRADLALFLGGPVDIETEPTTGAVILKVLKPEREKVLYTPFFEDLASTRNGSELPLIIGETENGTRLLYDLVNMPHLLIAGATGSGKSVFMHNCILSAIYNGKANIVLMDVKRVELSRYDGIPHATPVCYTASESLETLKRLSVVMDRRYTKLKENGARNIQEYNASGRGDKMQYIVVFIDELADLIMINRKIESYIIRLAQLGRAAGIHLVVATQRPDASILSGLIRANIPSRVCFAVQKATDSRIILDQSGGEMLRGRGDGLFLPIGHKTPVRFQAPYMPTPDLEKIIDKARHVNG